MCSGGEAQHSSLGPQELAVWFWGLGQQAVTIGKICLHFLCGVGLAWKQSRHCHLSFTCISFYQDAGNKTPIWETFFSLGLSSRGLWVSSKGLAQCCGICWQGTLGLKSSVLAGACAHDPQVMTLSQPCLGTWGSWCGFCPMLGHKTSKKLSWSPLGHLPLERLYPLVLWQNGSAWLARGNIYKSTWNGQKQENRRQRAWHIMSEIYFTYQLLVVQNCRFSSFLLLKSFHLVRCPYLPIEASL